MRVNEEGNLSPKLLSFLTKTDSFMGHMPLRKCGQGRRILRLSLGFLGTGEKNYHVSADPKRLDSSGDDELWLGLQMDVSISKRWDLLCESDSI